METIIYKNYVIAPETEPWAIKYGLNFIVYPEGQQGPDEDSKGFSTVEEAKECIDELTINSI